MSIVAAKGLCKRYRGRAALDDLSFELEPGRILGIIGPNGSGKSTALKCLMGLAQPDAGSVTVLGLNPDTQRAQLMRQTGYVADVGILPRWMRVDQLLEHVAAVDRAFDRNAAEALLADTRIDPRSRVRALSKGMATQLHLALVLATDSRLLILDEPTLGLDLLYRKRFYGALLEDYFADDRAIVLTTHEIGEVEHLLTDVVLMNDGRVLLSGSVESLAARFTKVSAPARQRDQLSVLEPLALKATFDGVEAIFDGGERQALTTLGSVSAPTLADLFVAFLEVD
ncbi:MAG: ABC transporter ATP-binding protein [Pseudomonadota bacterium]